MKEIIRSMYIAWVPGHKEIEGNVLADKQAKEAASEMSTPDAGFSLAHKFVRFDSLSTQMPHIFGDSAPHWAQFPPILVN